MNEELMFEVYSFASWRYHSIHA